MWQPEATPLALAPRVQDARVRVAQDASVALLALALLFPVLAAPGPRQETQPRDSREPPCEVVNGPLALRIDHVLRRLSGFDYSGSILLEKDGEVILRKAYGFADRPGRRAHDVGAVFDIGSLAKQFTAAAVLELEQRERLSTSDTLQRFFPEAPADKAGITLAQLLAHTAGLPADFPVADPARPDYDDVDEATAVARILALALEFPPGSSWSYSNCGYVLLAAVVQRASGRPFRDFVRDALWRPAGLRRTGFWSTAPSADVPVALGHDGFGNVLHDPAHMGDTWFDLGGGEVWSTLDDMRTWVHALGDATVLGPEAIERLLEPRARVPGSPQVSYAYGWNVIATPRSTRLVLHGGDYVGTGAEVAWFVDEDLLWITSTNVRHDTYPTRNRVDRALQDWIFERVAPPEVPEFGALDAPPPPGLEGAYRLATGGLLRLARIHGRLYVGAEGQDATDLLAGAPAQEEERAWRSRAGLAAVEGALRGEHALVEAVLGARPNPAFAGLFEQELGDLVRARGELRGVTLLGTFATGFPHGNPPASETTLVRVECSRGEFVEALRWSGRELGWTDVVPIPLACAVPLQLASDGEWVGWKILESQPLRLRVLAGEGAPAIEVEIAGRTVRARRS